MIMLKVIASGSSGNCYALCSDDEILLLDLGIKELGIKKSIDFRISDVVGCCVTHNHL